MIRHGGQRSYAEQLLGRMAKERLAKRPGDLWRSESLVNFVHEVSHGELDAPRHLAPYCDRIEDAPVAALRLAFHSPPQHGKTTSTERAFLYWDWKYPGKRHAYVTYNAEQAMYVSRRFQRVAEEAGFKPRGRLNWVTLRGGSEIIFTSVGGSLTGKPIDGVCVIDDPFKDFRDSQSATGRKNVIDWFESVAFRRRHKQTSFIIMATRWHLDDLTGFVIRNGWEYVCLKALADGPTDPETGIVLDDPLGRKAGEALWPKEKSAEFFAEVKKRDPYKFAALEQGEPVPDGNRKFHRPMDTVFQEVDGQKIEVHRGPRYWSELPTSGFRIAFGVDLAYTEKKDADWSVIIEAWEHNGLIYIIDVVREKTTVDKLAEIIVAKQRKRPDAKFRWYANTNERGMAAFLRNKRFGVRNFKALLAKTGKMTRAIPVSVAWNNGEVLVPDPELVGGCDWLEPFLDVVCGFTGKDDSEDDDVDALAAAYDELNPNRGGLLASLRR